jgi:hypothetical protein
MTLEIQRELDAVQAHIARLDRQAKVLKASLAIMKRLARKDEWTTAEAAKYDAAYRCAKLTVDRGY